MSGVLSADRPAVVPPAWAGALFSSQLVPISGDAAQTGLWTVLDPDSSATITSQFTDHAAEYDARYAHSEHFLALFKAGFAAGRVEVPDGAVILDLGSGSGVNSVLPCLEMFQAPTIIATDLSTELLTLLSLRLRRLVPSARVLPVVMDVMSEHLAPANFDLVTGAAILHHLEDPGRCLKAAWRALKPGGTAIFFEPFDGYCLLRLAQQRILAEARYQPLDAAIVEVLTRMIADTAARTRPDPASPAWRRLDDKWLFSREYVEEVAREAGFAHVTFVAHSVRPKLFRNFANIQLGLATGREDLAMPEWANAILDEFDDTITEAGKRAMMLEGTIVLTKGRDA
jgi:ubiquinone/menaquinone biosynthesis C-methylase UbiE